MSDLRQHILIIDDDRAVCASLRLLLERKGYGVSMAHSPADAMALLHKLQPGLVLLDMNFTISTSGTQGLKCLAQIREAWPALPVILLTGWATVQLAVEGMKLGARDFLAKPWDNKQLLESIAFLLPQGQTPPPRNAQATAIIGKARALLEVQELAAKIAPTDANVLITGESGTGKELLAEFVHQHSKRAQRPFVKTNLGGIHGGLLESELFGHVRGAFTDAHTDRVGRFTMAQGGTLFLDEIGELPLDSQVKMLRVLQEKQFEVLGSSKTIKLDARIISATNRDLHQMVANGSFREDLYYRINLIPLHIPPLRERRSDIPLLVEFFRNNIAETYGMEVATFSPEAMDYLMGLDYPGNVRQLKNVVERCLLMHPNQARLALSDVQKSAPSQTANHNWLADDSEHTLQEVEIALIRKALDRHQQSVTHAARALGLTRSSLYRRLDKYQIPYDA